MEVGQQKCDGDDPSLVKIGEIVKEVENDCGEVELVEIELFARENRKPPRAKKYKIRIDKTPKIVDQREITGKELLALVAKASSAWRLYQKRHGGHMQEVAPGETVDLGECGIERFSTIEKAQGDGELATAAEPATARRTFRLPDEDEAYLDTLGHRWETVTEGGGRWVLIHGHPMADGYNYAAVTLAIRVEPGYPPAALDMCYVYPPLARKDGKAIAALTTQALEGVSYQRWSRHYSWREGDDSLVSHHLRVVNWLVEELKR